MCRVPICGTRCNGSILKKSSKKKSSADFLVEFGRDTEVGTRIVRLQMLPLVAPCNKSSRRRSIIAKRRASNAIGFRKTRFAFWMSSPNLSNPFAMSHLDQCLLQILLGRMGGLILPRAVRWRSSQEPQAAVAVLRPRKPQTCAAPRRSKHGFWRKSSMSSTPVR